MGVSQRENSPYGSPVSASGGGLQEPMTYRGKGCLGASEWRQLLNEADALLRSNPEAKISPQDELEKVKHALVKLLGTEAQVGRAVSFLRERQPLGDTDEADELLLQVELLDIVG